MNNQRAVDAHLATLGTANPDDIRRKAKKLADLSEGYAERQTAWAERQVKERRKADAQVLHDKHRWHHRVAGFVAGGVGTYIMLAVTDSLKLHWTQFLWVACMGMLFVCWTEGDFKDDLAKSNETD